MEIKQGEKYLQKGRKGFIGIKLLLPVKSVIGRSNRMKFGLVSVTKPQTDFSSPCAEIMTTFYEPIRAKHMSHMW